MQGRAVDGTAVWLLAVGVGWTSAGPPSSVLSYQPSTSACPILLLSFDSKVHHVFLSAK